MKRRAQDRTGVRRSLAALAREVLDRLPSWSTGLRLAFVSSLSLFGLPIVLAFLLAVVARGRATGAVVDLDVARAALRATIAMLTANAAGTWAILRYARRRPELDLPRAVVIAVLSTGAAEILYYLHLFGTFSVTMLALAAAVITARTVFDRRVGYWMVGIACAGIALLSLLSAAGTPYAPFFRTDIGHVYRDPLVLWSTCVMTMIVVVLLHSILDVIAARMRWLSVTDGLTGLYNRRHFMERFERTLATARRDSGTVSLLLFDLDHFKRVNDRHGHTAGDAVLASVAATLREQVRTHDVVARYGGEEFAILLPATRLEGAQEVAERCRRALDGMEVAIDGGARIRGPTTSIGVATSPDHAEPSSDALIRLADRALYVAKADGRNRVRVAARA